MKPRQIRYTLEQLANVRAFGGLRFAPDSKRFCFVSDLSGQFNLWTMAGPGAFPVQLTFYKSQTIRGVAWSPTDDRLVFGLDTQGNERSQLFLMDLAGDARAVPLTDRADARYMLSGWSRDGRYLYYSTDDRDPAVTDAVRLEVATGKTARLEGKSRPMMAFAGDPNSRYVTVGEIIANGETRLFVWDPETGATHEVLPRTAPGSIAHAAWSHDGAILYFLTDHDHEFEHLLETDVAGGKPVGEPRVVRREGIEIVSAATSRDGRWLATSANRDGRIEIDLRDLSTGESHPIRADRPTIDALGGFTPDSKHLILERGEATRGDDFLLVDLTTFGERRLTESMSGGVRSEHLISPSLVRYPSFDRDIPAWFYRPEGPGPFPAILSVHGGPQWQETPDYNHFYQYVLQAGIAIVAPNVRGSTGYGKTYMKLIERDWGGGELRDLEHAARWMKSHPDIRPDRVAVYGGSFGGFAVLSCLTRLPDLFCAGVDIVGPSNLVTFVMSVPEFWKAMIKVWLGDPDIPADLEFLVQRSPLTHIANLKSPLMVVQGANDPRVAKAESEQMVAGLRARNVDVEYLLYEDEGHGFTKTENKIDCYKKVTRFLANHLLDPDERPDLP